MQFMTRVGLLAGATALTLTGVSYGGPAIEGANDELAQRLAAAEAKIASMEAAQNKDWLTEQRAAEIRGLVQDVLADADTRASLLQAGMTSGYDDGFVLGSSDGNWLLRTNFLMQQRFILNWQDDEAAEDTTRYGFENTRSRFMLSGHVVNPDWFYRVDINVGSGDDAQNDNRTGVGNAYLGHDYGNGWKVMMGSMVLPFMREQLVEPHHQLAVERSIVNYAFTTGYGDGLAVQYAGDQFHVTGMFSDGFDTGQTIWSLGPPVHAEYAFTVRGEVLLSGNWDQFKDFTSMPGSETGVMLGAAIHYEKGEFGTTASETEFLFLTGDVSVELGGVSLFGAFVYADTDTEGAAENPSPWAIVAQAGFYLNDTWELFGRLEWTDPDTEADETVVLTAGVNKYFSGHNMKWTTDIGFGFDSVVGPANVTGWRTDFGDSDEQVVLRTQWQLLF